MKLQSCKTACRRLGLVTMATGAAFLAGCLIIPVDYHAAGSRHNVSPRTSARLEPGVTTKEEVLFKLEEPDFASEDGQRIGYAWTKVKAIWFVASYSTATGGEIQRSYVLEAAFDASNRVSRVRLLKTWGPGVTPGRELENPH